MPLAFLVDGITEKKIVQSLCERVPVRLTGLNGRDVELSAIAKAAHSLISLFNGRYYPIVLIVDREKRAMSSADMEIELKRLLVERGVSEHEIIVSCPDRMIENWMLADTVYFDKIYDIQIMQNYEGMSGKTEIRQLLSQKKIAYHEVAVGVGVFCDIDPACVAQGSPSFDRFRRRMARYCPRWLKPIIE